MNVDLMRSIDKWVGIPLTFVATVLNRMVRLLTPAPARVKPARILFIELSEMGSTILADPAMRKARDSFRAELYFVIFQKNRPSLNLLNTVPTENVSTLREHSLFLLAFDVFRFVFWCRKNRIDTAIDLELFSRFSALLTWLSGARNRVGFDAFYNEGLYRGDLLTHKVACNPHLHIAKNFIALVNALAADKPELPYSKTYIDDNEISLPLRTFSEAEKADMRNRIAAVSPFLTANPAGRIVLINPNSSELLPQRCWPSDNFAALIAMLLAFSPDILVLVTGAPSEKKGSQKLVDQINNDRCVNFAGTLQLEELPVLYAVSDLMITNDSGPGHFSAVTSMPAIVLFGPETPALYGSLGNCIPVFAGLACSPCVSAANHRKTPCRDNVCLQVITPEMVFIKVKQCLEP